MKIAGLLKLSVSTLSLLGILSGIGCGPALDSSQATDAELAQQEAALHTGTLPPTSCDQRHAGVTAIMATVRIDKYSGLINGRNGTHEIAYGTIVSTPWVYDSKVVDTSNTQLALNVKSSKDPSGLPHEVKMAVGDLIELEGEYIPSSATSVTDANGRAAVIHFTHAPCGYITIGGTTYR